MYPACAVSAVKPQSVNQSVMTGSENLQFCMFCRELPAPLRLLAIFETLFAANRRLSVAVKDAEQLTVLSVCMLGFPRVIK